MITISIRENILILSYYPETPWVFKKFKEEETIIIKKSFEFSKSDIIKKDDYYDDEGTDGEDIDFQLGTLQSDGYFQIEGRKLMITQNVFINNTVKIKTEYFIGIRNTSIFKMISRVVKEDVYLGGEKDEAIPIEDYSNLLKEFPGQYELIKYVEDRLATVLENYFDSPSTILGKYERYMNKRQSMQGADLLDISKANEIIKYETILSKLENMLKDENKYNEKQWQLEIIDIILLLYPKYIYVFDEAPVHDAYKNKERKIDFLLVDSNGNVDIIEIKRPMGNKIITKSQYRQNFIPLRDLSGTVMQVEKYIFHLNKSGLQGETRLSTKFQQKILPGFKIRITNPGGIIIMGRETGLTQEQKEDFEVVKRKYKNVIDIITYDDLIRRLKSIISAWKNRN